MDVHPDVRRELICVCPSFNPPLSRQLTDELAGETILRSVELVSRQPFCWTLIDKPREGSLFLLFFGQAGGGGGSGGQAGATTAQGGGNTILEDGLAYLQALDKVRNTQILKEGYELEIKERGGGFLPGETVTSRERRMYRLKNLPKSGGREQLAAVIEGLTLVHYSPIPDHLRGPAPLIASKRSYPLPPLPPMLVYLFGPPQPQPPPPAPAPQSQTAPQPQGPPMDRVGNLSGRGQPKSASGSPAMAPNAIRPPIGRPARLPSKVPGGRASPPPQLAQSGPPEHAAHDAAGTALPQAAAPSAAPAVAMAPAPVAPPPPMFPLPPPQDLLITGDEFDRISNKDISLARYKRRHDLMSLVLSPYGLGDFEQPLKPNYAWACAGDDESRSVEDAMREKIRQLELEVAALER